MREVKFRGLRTDGSAWVYGDLCSNIYFKNETKTKCFYILQMPEGGDCDEDIQFIEVIPESVGQFTGLKDKNGKEIFEGDLLKVQDPYNGNWSTDSAEVIFSNDYVGGWVITNCKQNLNLGTRQNHLEIIGNIHSNPELLK